MRDWKEIREFPGYMVDQTGTVMNIQTGRILAKTFNTRGVYQVGMSKNTVQCKRAVATLVADAFLREHPDPSFDTPIHLNGDPLDNHASNLMWRPRWFALKFHRQFTETDQGHITPIRCTTTGEVFENAMHAATTHGLLAKEITVSIINRTAVWPTWQLFEDVE